MMKSISIITLVFILFVFLASPGICTGLFLFQMSFENNDLSDGCLTIVHGLGVEAQVVMVYNKDMEVIVPDEIDITNSNTTKIYIGTYGVIDGTWSVVLLGGN